MNTLLPVPVEPAISKWGMAARSVTRIRHRDRKSTRLNSSHSQFPYAVFCLKEKQHGLLQSLDDAPRQSGASGSDIRAQRLASAAVRAAVHYRYRTPSSLRHYSKPYLPHELP